MCRAVVTRAIKADEPYHEGKKELLVIISEQRSDFMLRNSTTDGVFAFRVLMEKSGGGQKELHFVFVDLERACDRVSRE